MPNRLDAILPKPVRQFLLRAGIVYAVYALLYQSVIHEHTGFEDWFTGALIACAGGILKVFGHDPYMTNFELGLTDQTYVIVGSGCIGIDLLFLFAGFIIAFRGPAKEKLIYIAIGMPVIQFLNVLRLVALAYMQDRAPEMLDFNHKYTFTLVMYLIIFLMWMYWVRRTKNREVPAA